MRRGMMLAGDVKTSHKVIYQSAQVSDATTYTFTGVPLGSPSTDRVLVIASGLDASGSTNLPPPTITVAGVTATHVEGISSGTSNKTRFSLAVVVVPSASSGNVVVTASRTCRNCDLAIWELHGYGTTATAMANDDAENATVATLSLVAGNGDLVIAGCHAAGSYTTTWAGLLEAYDIIEPVEAGVFTGASGEFLGTDVLRVITATTSGAPSRFGGAAIALPLL